MDKEWMRRCLPERPPEGYESWMKLKMAEEFVPDMMLFSAERLPYEDEKGKRHSVWAARCTCTACMSEFYTEHIKTAGVKAFAMYNGEDGTLYPLDPMDGVTPVAEEEIEDYGFDPARVEIGENDQITCPWCGEVVVTMHRSRLKGGRTRQLLGCTVQNVWGYTAVIYWLTARRWYDDGSYDVWTYPRDAYVIGERGGITRYRHTRATGSFSTEVRMQDWQVANSCRDSVTVPYHDWGSTCNRKIGGVVWQQVSIGKETGEKTGLEAYVKAGGKYPATYIKLWARNRAVENLVNAGWTGLIEDAISRYAEYNPRDLRSDLPGIDLKKKKPHEMLKMDKADFKAISRRGRKWDLKTARDWMDYKDCGGSCNALEFEMYYKESGQTGLDALIELRKQGDTLDFPKAKAYMDKQGLKLHNLRFLLDARKMAREMYPERELTPAELWPRRLRVAHDRLAELQAVRESVKKTEELQSGFDAIRQMCGELEWGDGDLRIVLPKGNDDLIREGSVLQHCVGGYGKGHVEGRGVIFFVRKYRRPERSYFTLDINMTGGAPREVQLHGYKNEHVRGDKQRKIPERVRSFVDRWKKEVLMPWYLAQQTDKKEKTA